MKSCPSMPEGFRVGLDSTNALHAHKKINTTMDYPEGSVNSKETGKDCN